MVIILIFIITIIFIIRKTVLLSDHFRDQRSDGEDEQQGLARQNSALFD